MTHTRPLFLLALLTVATASRASGESPVRWVIAGGGATGQSMGGHTHHSTLGQPVAGIPAGVSATLSSGFWGGGGATAGGERVYLPLVLAGAGGANVIAEAPDTCPGLAIQVGLRYAEDFVHSNDNDWYAVSVVQGQPTTIETLDLGPQADTILYLYGPDCTTLIAENDDRVAGDPSSRISWTPAVGGPYHILVRSYDYQVFGSGTDYTLRITVGDAGPDQPARRTADKVMPPPTPGPGGER
jgi:hypothetical protein